uniref:Branched-chain amino acid ABC transporter permease n=1 Tax=Thermogemmatispora argillosa TaxID=2045280 RepID=A0A455T1I5_9CHLR|nr:branched-chain amino acid ABC transporter permease [Thermogemmatispora argillosa]
MTRHSAQSDRPAGALSWWGRLQRLVPWVGWAVLGLLLVLAWLGPLYLSTFDLILAFTLFNYMTMAQSWNLLGGYGGQFSLGHSLFVGAGSYTIAVLLLHTGLPLLLDLLLSGLLAAVLATLAALLLMRLREAYFSIGSLGLAMASLTWMLNWTFTGATSGLNLPPAATLDYSTLYYLALGLLMATTLTIVLLVRSPFGLRLMAIRDDQEAAAELGVNSFPVKLVTFAISAFFVGIAGGLIALNKLEIEPDSAFSMNWVITMIIITIIGGIATSTGPLVGAVVFFTLQQVLQNSQDLSSLLTGLLLIVIIRLAPEGLWPLVLKLGRRLGEALIARLGPGEAPAGALTSEERLTGRPGLGEG